MVSVLVARAISVSVIILRSVLSFEVLLFQSIFCFACYFEMRGVRLQIEMGYSSECLELLVA